MDQRAFDGRESRAYRKHTQERRLPCILQSDHGYVHLCCPARVISMLTSFEMQHDQPLPGTSTAG